MNIFENASRKKLRFPSIRGELTVEMLWDMPLTSKTGFDLDTVARNVNQDLKSVAEESFVATKANPLKESLELKLDIAKYIIAAKIEAADLARTAAARKAEREQLVEILHQKKTQELLGMSAEDIQKRIAELGE